MAFSLAMHIGDLNYAVSSPAYKWPKWARRTYVLTWPVSYLVRATLVVTLILAFAVSAYIEYSFEKLKTIWQGETR